MKLILRGPESAPFMCLRTESSQALFKVEPFDSAKAPVQLI